MTLPQFDANTTSEQVMGGIDLTNKTALVTGAYSGLGEETAKWLAIAGAEVVLAGRDASKLSISRDKLLADAKADISILRFDLADYNSVITATDQLLQILPKLNLLINNAGIMACPLQHNAQGYELQFATNHLGHMLLTLKLQPLLLSAAKQDGFARLISLSSDGHKASDINYSDPNYLRCDYQKWQAYGQSKTANALLAVAMAKRLDGVDCFAVHPGMIATNLSRHMTQQDFTELFSEMENSGSVPMLKSIPQGAATTLWAATSPALSGQSPAYLADCTIANPVTGEQGDNGYKPYAMDAGNAERLWQLSEQLLADWL